MSQSRFNAKVIVGSGPPGSLGVFSKAVKNFICLVITGLVCQTLWCVSAFADQKKLSLDGVISANDCRTYITENRTNDALFPICKPDGSDKLAKNVCVDQQARLISDCSRACGLPAILRTHECFNDLGYHWLNYCQASVHALPDCEEGQAPIALTDLQIITNMAESFFYYVNYNKCSDARQLTGANTPANFKANNSWCAEKVFSCPAEFSEVIKFIDEHGRVEWQAQDSNYYFSIQSPTDGDRPLILDFSIKRNAYNKICNNDTRKRLMKDTIERLERDWRTYFVAKTNVTMEECFDWAGKYRPTRDECKYMVMRYISTGTAIDIGFIKARLCGDVDLLFKLTGIGRFGPDYATVPMRKRMVTETELDNDPLALIRDNFREPTRHIEITRFPERQNTPSCTLTADSY